MTWAKPWLRLPTRSTSPFRTYQTVPLTSRSRLTRSPTASTVPEISPRSTTSPTPYWSSRIMKIPDRKSFTRFCAPKPSATPTIPAPAMKGPSWKPISPRMSISASTPITSEATLRSSEPTVSARCRRRSEASPAVSSTRCRSAPSAA